MSQLVLLVGLLVSGISLFLIIQPGRMPGLLDKVFGSRWLYAVALLRLLLGAGLIAAAMKDLHSYWSWTSSSISVLRRDLSLSFLARL